MAKKEIELSLPQMIQNHLTASLESLADLLLRKYCRAKITDTAVLLMEAHCLQEFKRIVEKMISSRWALINKSGFISDDDALRAEPSGESIVYTHQMMNILVKLSEPPERFDLDTFIKKVSKKTGVSVSELSVLAEKSKIAGTPSLTKRVIIKS